MRVRAKPALFGLMASLVLALSYAARGGEVKQCTSSCGNITINYPFRVKGDPLKCGDHRLELTCENNRAVLPLYSGRYYVQEISYDNYTLRVVDASLDPDQCSIPRNSIPVDFDCKSPFFQPPYSYSYFEVFFLNCTKPVSSPFYVDASPCTNSSSSPHTYLYALYGRNPSDFHESCRIEVQVPIPVRYFNIKSPSIFDFLLIELSWEYCNRTCTYKISLRERFSNFWNGFKDFWETLWDDLQNGYWHDRMPYYQQPEDRAFIATTGGFILGRTTLGIFCLMAIIVYKFRRRHLSMDHVIEEFLQSQNNLMPIRYSYSDIKRMTNGFNSKIGQGGFGSVFKGKLRSGHLVAIKMLGRSKANGQDFINEVATIGRIHHVNVVRLAGFCVEGSKQALVYDFMPNRSLDKFIFSRAGNSTPLSWEKLYEIALGVARGIEYLHRGCEMQILHFDIKPHNILLDDNFNPKVSDFGLAKLCPIEDSIVSLTAAQGTLGYIAPELFYKNIGGVSYKADVYSFGMLLMEMVGRRKNLNEVAEQSSQIYFPSWIYDRFAQGEDMELEDATGDEKKIVRKMIKVAFWCIQMKPINRPSMGKVLEMLENQVEPQEMPPRPFLQSQEMSNEDNSSSNLAEESTISLNAITLNVM